MIGVRIKCSNSPQRMYYTVLDGNVSLENKIAEKNPDNLDSIKNKLAKEFEVLPENILSFSLYKD